MTRPGGESLESYLAARHCEYHRPWAERDDASPVIEFAARLEPAAGPQHRIAVVGSNGKTTAASLLADRLTAAGRRTGLFTSPHLESWAERVRIDGRPCAADQLIDAFEPIHEAAIAGADGSGRDPRVRFFDSLTLAADRVFGECGAEIGVYEAGIGGRRDAVRALDSPLVVLTSIALEHTDRLGRSLPEILSHKLDVAPPGATVVLPRLGPELDPVAELIADQNDLELIRVEADGSGPDISGRLAAAAERVVNERWQAGPGKTVAPSGARESASATAVPGRRVCGTTDGVSWIVDVAHNPAAWDALLRETPIAGVAVVALTGKRDPAALADSLCGGPISQLIATRTSARPCRDPDAIVSAIESVGIESEAVRDSAEAFERGISRARELELPFAVFGSTYLAGEFLSWARQGVPA